MTNYTPNPNADEQAEIAALRTRRLITVILFEGAFLIPLVLLFIFDIIPIVVFIPALIIFVLSSGALLYFMVVRPSSAVGQQTVTDADSEVPGASGTTGSTKDGYDPMDKFR